jgi:transcription initiation factor TFIID subunit TAF12
MHNDSIETLLLRHYGSTAPTPIGLEQRLQAATHHQVAELRQQQHVAARLRAYRLNRRRAVRLVALSTAGLGVLSAGLSSLHMLESALLGQDMTQHALT